MNIDTSINLSHIITLISMIGGGFYFVARMEANLKLIADKFEDIKRDVESIEAKVENHGLALVKLSNQEDRLVAMDTRMNELSRRMENIGIVSRRRKT